MQFSLFRKKPDMLAQQWQDLLRQPNTTMTILIVVTSDSPDKRELIPQSYRERARENTDYTALLNGAESGLAQAYVVEGVLPTSYQQLLSDFDFRARDVQFQTKQNGNDAPVITSAQVTRPRKPLTIEIFLDISEVQDAK